jgi:hypothetical protein
MMPIACGLVPRTRNSDENQNESDSEEDLNSQDQAKVDETQP